MINSKDYHDYFFKDGKFIGKFEEMYKNSGMVPWNQDNQGHWPDVLITQSIIPEFAGNIGEIHDLGCGLGYYLDLLNKAFAKNNCSCFGYDLSPTCIAQAETIFSDYMFSENNLITNFTLKGKKEKQKLVSLRGTIWYIVDYLDIVINNINNAIACNDFLLINQNFPPEVSNYYGKGKLPNSGILEDCLNKKFKVVFSVFFVNHTRNTNDNWYIGLFKKEQN